jgi:hypothetical protein
MCLPNACLTILYTHIDSFLKIDGLLPTRMYLGKGEVLLHACLGDKRKFNVFHKAMKLFME